MSLTANISSAKQFRRLAKSLNDSAIVSASAAENDFLAPPNGVCIPMLICGLSVL